MESGIVAPPAAVALAATMAVALAGCRGANRIADFPVVLENDTAEAVVVRDCLTSRAARVG